MEIKKSKEANTNNLRAPIFLIGLLFISSVVLASFSYSVKEKGGDDANRAKRSTAVTFQEEAPIEEPPPPPDEQPQIDVPPPPQEDIEIEENREEPPPVVTAPPTPPPVPVGPKDTPPPPEIIDFPDKEASFPGGAAAMARWIQENVQYPETSREMGDQGKVYVQFVVETDGSVTNVQVIRSVSPELDKEAKRVVRNMPNWDAGESNAKKVRTRVRLPINFTLN